jgi:hypothetical protein
MGDQDIEGFFGRHAFGLADDLNGLFQNGKKLHHDLKGGHGGYSGNDLASNKKAAPKSGFSIHENITNYDNPSNQCYIMNYRVAVLDSDGMSQLSEHH